LRLIFSLLMALVFVAGCSGGDETASAQSGAAVPDPLVMGIIPAEDNAEMIRAFDPVAEHVGGELGVEVELYTATDYSGIIESMRSGQVDAAWFGPLSYVLASEVAGAEAIAVQTTEDGQEDPSYRSLIITRAGSDIQSIEDLKGKTFSFVDPASTSGNLFPRKAFKEARVDPERDLAESTFAGGHDASALAVQNGTVDAGAVADTTLEGMIEGGVISEEEIRVIHESEPIPESPIAVREDLPPEVKQRIQEIFLDMTPEDVGTATLGSEDAVGYVEAKDSDYDVIRELVDTLNLDLEKLGSE
jgi:phosphonate transport system substrate-binding protein